MVAQEATKTGRAYECGVLETEAMLTVEVTVVCKEYCAETYNQALDRAGILAESVLKRVDQVYYPEDLRENTTVPPPPAALPLPLLEQSLTTQEPSQGAEVLARVEKEKKGVVVASRTKEKVRRRRRRRRRRKGRRRQRIKLMPTPPRTPLQLEIWFPRLKLLSPSLRLTPRKILINHRLRYRVLALFLCFFFFFW